MTPSYVAVTLFLLAIRGIWRALRRGPSPAELYLILTGVAIMLFQTSVADVRYLVPLLPLMLLYAADGAASLWRPGPARSARPAWLPAVVGIVLAALALGGQAARIPPNLDMIRQYRAGDLYAGYPGPWRNFFMAMEWAASEAPEDAVFTVRKPRLFNAMTGHRTVRYPYSYDTGVVRDSALTTDYVVLDQVASTTPAYLVPMLIEESEHFSPVWFTRDRLTIVFEVLDETP